MLKNLESSFGTKLSLGGEEAKQIKEMVEAGKADLDTQALYMESSGCFFALEFSLCVGVR